MEEIEKSKEGKMISTKRIDTIFNDCEECEKGETISVDFFNNKYDLDKVKVEGHRVEIESMLNELPDSFHEEGGGGHSFLNACVDKNDVQWGEQRNVALLMLLGIACGKVSYCLPKEMWAALPGGMPYFVVKKNEKKGN